jgi:hypothetical protein
LFVWVLKNNITVIGFLDDLEVVYSPGTNRIVRGRKVILETRADKQSDGLGTHKPSVHIGRQGQKFPEGLFLEAPQGDSQVRREAGAMTAEVGLAQRLRLTRKHWSLLVSRVQSCDRGTSFTPQDRDRVPARRLLVLW